MVFLKKNKDMQIPKSEKKFLAPPPSQILGTPLPTMPLFSQFKNLR